MHVVQTAAVPPNHGRIWRAISGCTRNSRNDDKNMVAAYAIGRAAELFFLNPLGELRRQPGVAAGRQREQALFRFNRYRQRAHERRELLLAEPPAARQRLQLLLA